MKKKSTLLEKAKSIKTQRRGTFEFSEEMQELTLAWCRDEVTHGQVAKALGLNNTGYRVYAKLALTLKQIIKKQ